MRIIHISRIVLPRLGLFFKSRPVWTSRSKMATHVEHEDKIIKVYRREMETSVENWNFPDSDNIKNLLLGDVEKDIIVEMVREDEKSGLQWGKFYWNISTIK